MRLKQFRIQPYLDGREGDRFFLSAYDYNDAIKQIEDSAVLEYDCYTVWYDVIEEEDITPIYKETYLIEKKWDWE
jgi:hypothetical protein